MSIYSRILFAVKDTDPRRSSGLAKVVTLAREFGASVELFHAISAPLYLPERAGDMTLADVKHDTIDFHRTRLNKIAAKARRLGIDVTCSVAWDHPPHEAIARRAVEWHADLVVAHCLEGDTRKWLLRLTDWELIKVCPVPVLLLRDRRPYRHPVILAAVDPVNSHDKPADLDDEILGSSRILAATLRGKLHVVHANHPPLTGIVTRSPYALSDVLSHARHQFSSLLERGNVPPARAHLVDGDPGRVIPRVADELHAGIVVMGAVSRSVLKRILIGHTAERVLGRLDCDVLVVKPRDFELEVPLRHREAVVLTPAPSSVFAG